MALPSKPSIKNVWATSGLKVEPSDAKVDTGWIVERPPHQFQNFLQNRVDQFIKHVNEAGIPVWDAVTIYTAGKSYVQGSDGKIYKCVTDGFNQNPVGNPTNWSLTFGDVAVQEFANIAEAAAIEAEASAESADSSATSAAASEDAAAASAAAALISENNADASETAAVASAAAALASQSAAATSATNAQTAYTGSQDIWEDLQVILEDGPVISVNDYVGVVTLTKADFDLENVANLAPADLPVSTATATALAGKQATLGFTPVRQGGGIGQDNSTVYVGWDGTGKLKATVNYGTLADLGGFVFDAEFATALGQKANIASPTFTSSATIQSTTFPTLTLNKTTTSSSNQIIAKSNGTSRWTMILGDSAENFTLNAYNSSGAYVSTPFQVSNTGNITSSGSWNHNAALGVGGAITASNVITSTSAGNAFTSTGYGVSGSVNFNNFMQVNPTYNFVMSAQHSPGVYAQLEFQFGAVARFQFDSNGQGRATSGWTTFSDANLKDELEVITDALDKVDQLTGYTYIRTDASEEFGANLKRHAGLIAQDVQGVLPEVVDTATDGYLTLNYDGVIPLLVNAIKELKAQVNDLQQRLNA
jgi:hypothetical protein